MVEKIRITESAMGDGVKVVTDNEKQIKKMGRRSITAVNNINKGEKISMDKIKILRPGTGIEPKYIDSNHWKKSKRKCKKESNH